ncbi:cell division control 14, SIN component [Metschnikowia bicuspidata var. bicuspidata NRRL YB-4993]|uniref:Cell division control 14, SIN component n=1 Tax=Metschnikowia bicuspidata var. bicuspidata NRRL YB-4993 TaxID=869754 RepID=A0A1A0HFV2_9ASCO|nr:cell division control 14, SIN component [Metschnikowia bicuspidata var. bicuspidata NRRL YB-4993]OBA22881.1 cell division control 14, SIN component [Metschnikowia bicuspidata var. bicuspidata NRRL YB-4993]
MEKDLEGILDHLNSRIHQKISRGLDSLENFLKSFVPSIRKYHRSSFLDNKLASLIALQNNFQYNLASGFMLVYSTFSKSSEKIDDYVLIKTNYLLSGILLIHPESRALFGRGQSMALMLSFLNSKSSAILEDLSISFVSLFIHILMKNLKNVRLFEANNGCQLLIHHLSILPANSCETSTKESDTSRQRNLHFKVIEFLIFYLADETELLDLPQNVGAHSMSVREKADLLRPQFPGIDDLIKNLSDLTSLR